MKTRLAAEIGCKSRLFRVPEIVSVDNYTHTISTRRIDNLVPLRSLKDSSQSTLALYRRAGEALAEVHKSLLIPDSCRVVLPEVLNFDGPKVSLHGDYSKQNVCFVKNGGEMKLVIIDWQMTDIYGGSANHGTPYFDVGWFLSGLFIEMFLLPKQKRNVRKRASSFISGYMINSPTSKSELQRYCMKLSKVRDKTNKASFSNQKYLLTKVGRKSWENFITEIADIK